LAGLCQSDSISAADLFLKHLAADTEERLLHQGFQGFFVGLADHGAMSL
jgi:hypothetical protein